MGEIVEYIKLYIENENVLEDALDDMSVALKENIQNQLYYGHGRREGNLKDSIENDYAANGSNGIVRAYIGDSAPYGVFVNEGHTLRNGEWWEGYHFLESGLEETVALYK